MLKCLLLIISFFSFPIKSRAIVIRHDKPDRKYQELATKYAASIVYFDGCVGTIVAPRWIITAKHCFEGLTDELSDPLKLESLLVEHLGRKYPARKVIFHPQADIALVELLFSPEDARSVKLYPKQDEKGMIVTFIGNGGFGNGEMGLTKYDQIKRAAINKVEKVDQSWIYFNFDRPPKALELEGISGPGDSGGPALIEQDNEVFILGVSSGQENNGVEGVYGVKEYYARISTYLDWIEQTMQKSTD